MEVTVPGCLWRVRSARVGELRPLRGSDGSIVDRQSSVTRLREVVWPSLKGGLLSLIEGIQLTDWRGLCGLSRRRTTSEPMMGYDGLTASYRTMKTDTMVGGEVYPSSRLHRLQPEQRGVEERRMPWRELSLPAGRSCGAFTFTPCQSLLPATAGCFGVVSMNRLDSAGVARTRGGRCGY